MYMYAVDELRIKRTELMTKKEIKQVLKDNSKSLGDTTVIYETWYDDVVEDLYNLANSSNDIQNVSTCNCPIPNPSKLGYNWCFECNKIIKPQ